MNLETALSPSAPLAFHFSPQKSAIRLADTLKIWDYVKTVAGEGYLKLFHSESYLTSYGNKVIRQLKKTLSIKHELAVSSRS